MFGLWRILWYFLNRNRKKWPYLKVDVSDEEVNQ